MQDADADAANVLASSCAQQAWSNVVEFGPMFTLILAILTTPEKSIWVFSC